MYFPVLRGKLHELQALLAVAPVLVAAGNVLPIVEPVRDRWDDIAAILNAGLRIGVVVNPQHGDYSLPGPRSRRVPVHMPDYAAAIFEHARARPTFVAHLGTTAAQARSFLRSYGERRHYVYVRRRPRDRTVLPLVTAAPFPSRLLIRRNFVVTIPPRIRNVDIVTTYRRPDRNAEFTREEIFTTRIADIDEDLNYGHFGDYSIEGTTWREGGGGHTRNVALHLIYASAGPRTPLHIRHYVSKALPSLGAMCRQALGLLVDDVPSIIRASRINDTIALREMVAHYNAGDAYALGEAKEIAIRHHLELMTRALGALR
jgi:hypothetical protein